VGLLHVLARCTWINHRRLRFDHRRDHLLVLVEVALQVLALRCAEARDGQLAEGRYAATLLTARRLVRVRVVSLDMLRFLLLILLLLLIPILLILAALHLAHLLVPPILFLLDSLQLLQRVVDRVSRRLSTAGAKLRQFHRRQQGLPEIAGDAVPLASRRVQQSAQARVSDLRHRHPLPNRDRWRLATRLRDRRDVRLGRRWRCRRLLAGEGEILREEPSLAWREYRRRARHDDAFETFVGRALEPAARHPGREILRFHLLVLKDRRAGDRQQPRLAAVLAFQAEALLRQLAVEAEPLLRRASDQPQVVLRLQFRYRESIAIEHHLRDAAATAAGYAPVAAAAAAQVLDVSILGADV